MTQDTIKSNLERAISRKMTSPDIADKLGFTLLKKGVIDADTLEKALRIKEKENPTKRLSLAQILVKEFNADHDQVFRHVATLYGFSEGSNKFGQNLDNLENFSQEIEELWTTHKP